MNHSKGEAHCHRGKSKIVFVYNETNHEMEDLLRLVIQRSFSRLLRRLVAFISKVHIYLYKIHHDL